MNMDEKDKNEIMKIAYLDGLTECFEKQLLFQKKLGYDFLRMDDDERIQYIKDNTLAMIDEIMETLHEIPWKPWKKNQVLNKEAYRKELVDLFHFFMNACLVMGMDGEMLYDKYLEKLEENLNRQINKY
jgi:hypothetical protein